MKNVKLIVLATITMLFLGIGNVYAQEKGMQSVLVSVRFNTNGTRYTIEVVKPDYNVELNKYAVNDVNPLISLKKEIDKWKSEGFIVDEMSSGSGGAGLITTIILSKKD